MNMLSKLLCGLLVGVGLHSSLQAQSSSMAAKPRLIVGIMVDQMRFDYLLRYQRFYGKEGFNRLMSEGFTCSNTHYNYIPTKTAPGHASVFTGSTPALHGIIGNDWYDTQKMRKVYCVEDSMVNTVGSDTKNGRMSPANLLTTTITDELRIANQKSKVIGISLKDRGAILPAGHAANAAYWFDRANGKFITSSFYMDNLPAWVNRFNDKKYADLYLNQKWETLYPIAEYTESHADEVNFEDTGDGKGIVSKFPINPKEWFDNLAAHERYEALPATPSGNTIVTDFALEAVLNEGMGKDEITDFLTVSYSAPDYVGHNTGTQSVETQDLYIRLDREIQKLLEQLDKNVGKGEYLIFLTADHAAAHVPEYFAKTYKMNTGQVLYSDFEKPVNEFLSKKYGDGKWISFIESEHIYLNRKLIKEKNLDREQIQKEAAEIILQTNGVYKVLIASDLHHHNYSEGIAGMMQRGYNQKISGDIFIVYIPNWFGVRSYIKGTTHGSGFSYDTHVPLLWYGKGIKKGKSMRKIAITDIAPTLSSMLDLTMPSGCTGLPIMEVLED